MFDILALEAKDLRPEPLRVRRRHLEMVLAEPDPALVLSPATQDRAVAAGWLSKLAAAHVGIEGIVAKGLDQPYRGGVRDWLKYRHRDTVEVIVGAVTGSAARPERLILGLYYDGGLRIVGGTSALTADQQRGLTGLVVAAGGDHPWPAVIGGGHIGTGAVTSTSCESEPDLVVEIDADTAFEHGRWRHVTTFVRPRPDLRPADTVRPR